MKALALSAVVASLSHAPFALAQDKSMPKPDAQALWNYLQKQNYQKTFKLFPGKDKLYKGIDPHGAWLTTYVNDVAYKALVDKKGGALPARSMVVKENYGPEKKLASVTVMYKVPGYNPEANNWFWLKRDAAGKVEAAGKVDGCIGCHSASKRDYIMTPVKMK